MRGISGLQKKKNKLLNMKRKEIMLEKLDSDFTKHDREFLQVKAQLTAAVDSALAM